MKTIIKTSILAIILCFTFGNTTLSAQTVEKKTETFKVYGNCDMCKETIETALKKKDGVFKKDWNTKTKMITVSFDPTKISLTQIKQKISDVGYDTDSTKAKDEVYDKLHKCCKYTRVTK